MSCGAGRSAGPVAGAGPLALHDLLLLLRLLHVLPPVPTRVGPLSTSVIAGTVVLVCSGILQYDHVGPTLFQVVGGVSLPPAVDTTPINGVEPP